MSEKDNNFYIGFTKDLKRRLEEHKKGSVTPTASRRPLKLIYYEACLNEQDAVNREKYFKTGFGRRFLRNRLESFLERIHFRSRDGGQGIGKGFVRTA
jgi:putative endonuclease